MADSIKHTLKKCDEITEKFLTTNHRASWFEDNAASAAEPHMIELPMENFHQAEEIDLRTQHSDHKKYNIIKYVEADGQVIEEKLVIFNVSRIEKDLLLRNVLKPKTLRVHSGNTELMRKYRAEVVQ